MPGNNGHDRLPGRSHDSNESLATMLVATPQLVQGVIHQPNISLPAQPISAGQEQLEFRQFPDGTLVELIRDPTDPKGTSLLIWKDGQAEIRRSFQHHAREFVAPRLEPSLLEAVRLPAGVVPCGSTDELLLDLQRCFSEHIEANDEQVRLLCHFALCSWFQDLFPVVPYLWIVGPYSSGKSKLLRLLHALCRRGITGSDFSPASLYSVPGLILPTLIIDEFELRRSRQDHDLLRLLRTGNAPGGQVVRGKRLFKTFCAKVIASRQGPPDNALASRAIFIPLRPSRRAFPVLDNATLDAMADHFQPRMLSYRLQHYTQVHMNSFTEMPGFTPRMRDLALAMAAPLLGDAAKEKQLFDLLAAQNQGAKLDVHGEPEWAVATALYDLCHGTGGALTAGTVAWKVAEVLAAGGETYELTPRAVGEVLRSLGFLTVKLGNQGRGLRLTHAVLRQIHQVVRDLGLNRSDILPYLAVDAGQSGLPCALCEEFELLVDHDGNKLRCVSIHERSGSTLYS